jgi:glycosyltransferase involved in cell wall biosynthesis
MKKDLIIIFTFKYPFEPPTEQFLDDEMRFLAEEDADILLVPSARKRDAAMYEFPGSRPEVSVCGIERSSRMHETCAGLLTSALHFRYLRDDIRRVIRAKQLQGRSSILKGTLKEHIQAGALYRGFIRQIPGSFFRGRNRIILYSYWLNPAAAAEALFKRYLEKRYSVPVAAYARAHGDGDLYLAGRGHCRPCLTLLNEEIDTVFPISRDGRESLLKDGLLRAETYRLGVKRLSPFLPAANAVPLVVSCSVVNDNKRVEKIAEILSRLPREVRWVHFGGGEKEQAVRSMCEKSLPGTVRWELRGWTPHDDIMAFYRKERPDLFLNVSRVEGIPVSIMEAMSCSIPCVATDTGASGEIVTDGRNGFLLPVEFDADDTARKLNGYLSGSEEDRNLMRRNAFAMFEQEYDSAVNYAAFARRIVSGGTNARQENASGEKDTAPGTSLSPEPSIADPQEEDTRELL